MRDEQLPQAQLFLQAGEQLQDLRLDRDREPPQLTLAERDLVGAGLPSNVIEPVVGSSMSRIIRARVDLPGPDSPTTATVEPRGTSRLTPSTAVKSLLRDSRPPPRIEKTLLTSLTDTRMEA